MLCIAIIIRLVVVVVSLSSFTSSVRFVDVVVAIGVTSSFEQEQNSSSSSSSLCHRRLSTKIGLTSVRRIASHDRIIERNTTDDWRARKRACGRSAQAAAASFSTPSPTWTYATASIYCSHLSTSSITTTNPLRQIHLLHTFRNRQPPSPIPNSNGLYKGYFIGPTSPQQPPKRHSDGAGYSDSNAAHIAGRRGADSRWRHRNGDFDGGRLSG